MATSAPFASLLQPVVLRRLAQVWLEEDTPSFDYGGHVVGDREETAVILAKSPGVLAGVPFVDAIFAELGCTVEWMIPEGHDLIMPNTNPAITVARVHGKARHLLLGERVALNILARASGISSGARHLRHLADVAGWRGRVAGTRKTTPGFRAVEKYALLVGGVDTHRYDLSSMVMLKDNHIWSSGNITQAVQDTRNVCGFSLKIEVECRSLSEAQEAARAGADVVMMDNFTPSALHIAAAELKSQFPHVLVEASGGITAETLSQYLGPHVDVVSLSKLTQGYTTTDFSMKICRQGRDPSNPLVTLTS